MRVETSFGFVILPKKEEITSLSLLDLTDRIRTAEKARTRRDARNAKFIRSKMVALGHAYRLLMCGILMDRQPAGVTLEAALVKAIVVPGPSESRIFAEALHGARLLKIHPDQFLAGLEAGDYGLFRRCRDAGQVAYKSQLNK